MTSTTLLDRVVADKNKDEQAWFDARRQGVTATDIRELDKSSSAWSRLLKEKRDDARTFTGNAYTNWGLEREAVISEQIQKKFGITPSDITFHAEANNRHLATPDGVALKDGLVTISEIKTSKHDLTPGGDGFNTANYFAQVQWQMYVAGDDVTECLFAWETRLGEPGAFTAGDLNFEWIERDEECIDRLIALADSFLAELDGDGDDPDDYAELVYRHVQIQQRAKTLEVERAEVEAAIRSLIGDRSSFAVETQFGKVSFSTPKPSSRFDSTAFKSMHPDMYKEFSKPSQSKPSLRITAAKEAADDVF